LNEAGGPNHAGKGTTSKSAGFGQLPHFKHESPSVHSRHFGRILIGDQVFHQIDNAVQFHQTFGNECDGLQNSSFAEEFLWDRYRRDGAKMSQQCFSLQVAVYLRRYSRKFTESYVAAYEAMIGKCSLDCVDSADAHCAKCPMHPR
jgi:hypothetical protein